MATRSSRRTQPRPGAKRGARESSGSLLKFVLTVALLAWAFRSFIAAPFNIPSGSMLPTLYIGDYIIVGKWPYGYSRYSFPFGFPAFKGRVFGHSADRGDVIVFRHPTEKADLIKRVIGLPGDRIEVRGGRIILNGQIVPRTALAPVTVPLSTNSPCRTIPPAVPRIIRSARGPSCAYAAYLETLPGGPSFTTLDQVQHSPADDFAETIVPPGHLFLMGDNRDDSLDSRYAAMDGGIGMVPMDNVIGRALFTFWSTNGDASWLKPWTWWPDSRPNRIGNGYTGAAK
jgi:signal peptidase I